MGAPAAAARPAVDMSEFENAAEKRPQTTGERRGGRGGRGGRGRGGADGEGERDGGERRGGRGERRGGRGGDRGGRGGDRGGRGGRGERGGRPRTAAPAGEGEAQVDRAERGGQRDCFRGKAREDAHPMDRQDGTGKANRGDRKGGRGRGGDRRPRNDDNEETKATTGADEETKEPKRERRPEPVVEEEEEEVGFTLDDYFAAKQAKSTGLDAAANAGREKEKITEKTKGRDGDKQRITTIDKKLTSGDTHAVRPDVNANLLAFQAREDDDFEGGSRGGRGGRGGRGDRGPREPRQGGRGGRRGGKMAITDDDFPAL